MKYRFERRALYKIFPVKIDNAQIKGIFAFIPKIVNFIKKDNYRNYFYVYFAEKGKYGAYIKAVIQNINFKRRIQ